MTDGENSEDCRSFLQNTIFITIKSLYIMCISLYKYRPDDGFKFAIETCIKMIQRFKKRAVSCNCYIHLTNQWGHSILKLTPESFRKCEYDARNE